MKRAAPNGKPVNLYVELLVVTDDSIYEQHKVFAATDNKDLVFQYMKTYFSYYVNGVSFCNYWAVNGTQIRSKFYFGLFLS